MDAVLLKKAVAVQTKKDLWDTKQKVVSVSIIQRVIPHTMNKLNRDLLVLFNQELMTPQAIEHEVEMLHELLQQVEQINNLVTAYEVINVNKHKVINSSLAIRKTLRRRELDAFVFLNNKN